MTTFVFRRWLPAALLLTVALTDCARRPRPATAPTTVAPVAAPPTPTTAARDLADVMTNALRLRPDQTLKVRQILNNTVAEANAARQQHPASSAPLNAALKRINDASNVQMRQALGPAKYKEFLAKRTQIQAELQQQRAK